MTTGGENGNQKSKHVLKIAGLITPLALTAYGLLVLMGLIPGSPLANLPGLIVLVLSWLVLGYIQILRPPRSRSDTFTRMIGHHILSGGYLILISGLYSPLTALWLVLMLSSYVYGRATGLRLNVLMLLAVFLVETALRNTIGESFSATDPWLLALILISGFIAVLIIKYHEIDQVALIRSQKQEMIQRERTLTLVNNMADGVLSTDPDGTIRVYNAAAISLLDTNDSLIGQHIDDVMKPKDGNDKDVSLFRELKKARGVKVLDDLNLHFDEERIRLEVTLSPIRRSYSSKQDHGDGYILIIRDVTKAKSLEEERDEFISVVSHELRTPITIAEGTISNVQVLLERGDVKPKVLSEAIDSAHEQVLFLARMVNDLSTLSRAERGVADDMETIDVKDLSYSIYNKYTPEAASKGLHLNIDTSGNLGKVYASRLYLEELIQNFITNAIKYTHEGSVTLMVSSEGGKVKFAVKDTGIGISKTDQKGVFDKFYRAEDYRTRETSGTGLGLYVASKLARKLNTKIKLSSRLNHGSTFSFTLQQLKPDSKKKKSGNSTKNS